MHETRPFRSLAGPSAPLDLPLALVKDGETSATVSKALGEYFTNIWARRVVDLPTTCPNHPSDRAPLDGVSKFIHPGALRDQKPTKVGFFALGWKARSVCFERPRSGSRASARSWAPTARLDCVDLRSEVQHQEAIDAAFVEVRRPSSPTSSGGAACKRRSLQ